jgi:hypothetical protein
MMDSRCCPQLNRPLAAFATPASGSSIGQAGPFTIGSRICCRVADTPMKDKGGRTSSSSQHATSTWKIPSVTLLTLEWQTKRECKIHPGGRQKKSVCPQYHTTI